eukprot:jgi/Ulvmu1/6088/UM027_0066.1
MTPSCTAWLTFAVAGCLAGAVQAHRQLWLAGDDVRASEGFSEDDTPEQVPRFGTARSRSLLKADCETYRDGEGTVVRKECELSGGHALAAGVIAMIVVFSLIGICCIPFIIFLCCLSKANRKKREQEAADRQAAQHAAQHAGVQYAHYDPNQYPVPGQVVGAPVGYAMAPAPVQSWDDAQAGGKPPGVVPGYGHPGSEQPPGYGPPQAWPAQGAAPPDLDAPVQNAHNVNGVPPKGYPAAR